MLSNSSIVSTMQVLWKAVFEHCFEMLRVLSMLLVLARKIIQYNFLTHR